MCESVDTEKLVSLALDSKQDLVYYADNNQSFIGEVTIEGIRRRRLFNTTRRPYAIVVDSKNR